MITTLHDGKAQFEALVERASHGEEVLITVDGKVKARLIAPREAVNQIASAPFDGKKWWDEMRALHRQYPATGRPMLDILDELRA